VHHVVHLPRTGYRMSLYKFIRKTCFGLSLTIIRSIRAKICAICNKVILVRNGIPLDFTLFSIMTIILWNVILINLKLYGRVTAFLGGRLRLSWLRRLFMYLVGLKLARFHFHFHFHFLICVGNCRSRNYWYTYFFNCGYPLRTFL